MAARATTTESGLLLLHKHRESLERAERLEAAYSALAETHLRTIQERDEALAELAKYKRAFELAKKRGKEEKERKRKLGILY